jgi:tetratricopeptide (TPR) repeat protein
VAKPPPFDLKKLLRLQDGRTLNDISYILISAHRFKDALPFAQKAYRNTTTNPVHAYATFNLGYVLLKRGDCKRSIQLFEEALPNEPPDQQALVRHRIKVAKKSCGRS